REWEMRPGEGLPRRVLESGVPVWSPDVLVDPHFVRTEIAELLRLRGFVGFPIRTADGIVGVMEFFARQVREPEPDLLDLLTALGAQIGEYVEGARRDDARRASEART